MLIAKVIETYNAYLRKISPHQENCFPLCRCIGVLRWDKSDEREEVCENRRLETYSKRNDKDFIKK